MAGEQNVIEFDVGRNGFVINAPTKYGLIHILKSFDKIATQLNWEAFLNQKESLYKGVDDTYNYLRWMERQQFFTRVQELPEGVDAETIICAVKVMTQLTLSGCEPKLTKLDVTGDAGGSSSGGGGGGGGSSGDASYDDYVGLEMDGSDSGSDAGSVHSEFNGPMSTFNVL